MKQQSKVLITFTLLFLIMNAPYTQSAVSVKRGDKVEHQFKIIKNNFEGSTGTIEGNITHVVTATEQFGSLGGDICYNADHIITYSNGSKSINNVSHPVYKIINFPILEYKSQNGTDLLISFWNTLFTTGEGLIANGDEFFLFEYSFTVIYKISVHFETKWDKEGRLKYCHLEIKNELGNSIKYEIGKGRLNPAILTVIMIGGGFLIMFIIIKTVEKISSKRRNS